jgi:hypothetical protein
LEAFKTCFKQDALDIAIKIWNIFGEDLQSNSQIEEVMQSVVDALADSPSHLEPKMFLLMELFD